MSDRYPQKHWRKGRPANFAAYCQRLGIDWRGAVIFRNKIVAEAIDGSLWQLSENTRVERCHWLPLIAIDVRHSSASKHALQNMRPQQQRADEKRDRRERRRLSSNMTEHDTDSGARSHHAADKSLTPR